MSSGRQHSAQRCIEQPEVARRVLMQDSAMQRLSARWTQLNVSLVCVLAHLIRSRLLALSCCSHGLHGLMLHQ